ncbi:MAG: PASTA domain-containing protein [Pyrinomonadaceae bacterium]
MGLGKTLATGLGRLVVAAVLLAAFLGAMAGVVYMSLSGEEITVPEITGKDFFESQKELAALGLKIKKRADRPSTEMINTILEQRPRAGETVKTGQLIFVVVSKAGVEAEEPPKSLIKDLETDDSKTIEDMISDKPKKSKKSSNSNSKKKADTSRDVNSDDSKTGEDAKDNSNSKGDDPEKGPDPVKEPSGKSNKSSSISPGVKPRPSPVKETRPRNQPKP